MVEYLNTQSHPFIAWQIWMLSTVYETTCLKHILSKRQIMNYLLWTMTNVHLSSRFPEPYMVTTNYCYCFSSNLISFCVFVCVHSSAKKTLSEQDELALPHWTSLSHCICSINQKQSSGVRPASLIVLIIESASEPIPVVHGRAT